MACWTGHEDDTIRDHVVENLLSRGLDARVEDTGGGCICVVVKVGGGEIIAGFDGGTWAADARDVRGPDDLHVMCSNIPREAVDEAADWIAGLWRSEAGA